MLRTSIQHGIWNISKIILRDMARLFPVQFSIRLLMKILECHMPLYAMVPRKTKARALNLQKKLWVIYMIKLLMATKYMFSQPYPIIFVRLSLSLSSIASKTQRRNAIFSLKGSQATTQRKIWDKFLDPTVRSRASGFSTIKLAFSLKELLFALSYLMLLPLLAQALTINLLKAKTFLSQIMNFLRLVGRFKLMLRTRLTSLAWRDIMLPQLNYLHFKDLMLFNLFNKS